MRSKQSAMQTIQSSAAPIEVRAKGDVDYKTIVCAENYNLPVNTQVNTVDTFCGRAVGLGVIEFNPTVSAVYEDAPDSTMVSYQQMLEWQVNKTLLEFRVQYPGSGSAGSHIYLSGECYATATELQGAVNEVLKFTSTLTGQGVIDIDPS